MSYAAHPTWGACDDEGVCPSLHSSAAGPTAAERRGRAILKVLNALITAHIGNDAQLGAEWKMAKMAGRKPGPAAGRGHGVDATPIHRAEGVATSPSATAPVMAAA